MSTEKKPRRMILEYRPWVRYAAPGGGAWCRAPATLRGLARGGALLLLAGRPEAHVRLVLELRLPPDGRPRSVRARVVYVGPHDGGGWEVVCAFAEELTEADLRAAGAG